MQYTDAFLAQRGIGAHDPPDGHGYLYAVGEVLVDEMDQTEAREVLLPMGATADVEEASEIPIEIDPAVVARDLATRLPRGFNIVDVSGGGFVQGPRSVSRPANRDVDDRLRENLGFHRWYLPPGLDAEEVATHLRHVPGRASRGRAMQVRPNHVLSFEPYYQGGPGALPSPTGSLDAPMGCDASINVAILDTGILDNWADDPWFTGRVDACEDDHEVLDSDHDGVLDLQTGHGTFIAGVVARLAPCARLLARRVLDSFGLTDEVNLAVAIRNVADDLGDGVLNLSLGGYLEGDQASPVISRAFRALSPHAAVVAAAGNAASTRPFHPAAMKHVLAVGAIDQDQRPASFSNRGDWVDCCALGQDVESRFVQHHGPQRGRPDPDNFDGYAIWSGTSFATPVVAARIAQTAVDDSISPAKAVRRLLRTRERPTLPGLGVIVT